MMASGRLQEEFAKNRTTIDGKFNDMSSISKMDVHGNPGVNAKEREEAKKIADSVKQLWQNLFDEARSSRAEVARRAGSRFCQLRREREVRLEHQSKVPRPLPKTTSRTASTDSSRSLTRRRCPWRIG